MHEVKLSTGEVIEQSVPAIVASELRERALSRLEDNRRNSGGRPHRKYLLTGLIECAVCGSSCVGRTATARGKKYPYYRCNDDNAERSFRAARGHAPYIPAPWLEETVWADVRRFLENPGEVIKRIQTQRESDDTTTELKERHSDLTSRLAEKHKERDRWLHLYAQGHILEDELDIHLADLRNLIENLKLLLSSVENELALKHERAEVAKTTEAWLLTLRERTHEIEGDSQEAFEKRRELVKLLVAGITAGRDEEGNLDVRITYRFGPPEPLRNEEAEEDMFVHGVQNSVIQCGADNPYGHPTPETLDRLQRAGARVFRNDEDGDVIVTIDEAKVEVAVTNPEAAF